MKINFGKPIYVIPLIVFPFLLIFFYSFREGFKKSFENPADTPPADSLQAGIAEVSEQVKSQPLATKLATYKQRYRDGDGYTAISQLKKDRLEEYRFDELYSARERQKLDSIEAALKKENALSSPDTSTVGFEQQQASEHSVKQALASLASPQDPPIAQKPEPAPDPMELFRMQMAYADSMAKANDPDYQAAQQQAEQVAAQKEPAENPPLLAKKYIPAGHAFNTLQPGRAEMPIQAIIDQNITGTAGSRLRIRLADDMLIGTHHIKKGTYLYATISGFSGQRVLLSINSVMQGGSILPVQLELYDNDGAKGLYVPASAFREFSKELGGSTTQGMNLAQQAQNNSQLVMSTIQRMFQSTSSAVAKQIRKNKVKLKYNTVVYLVDPSELQKISRN